MMFLENHTKFDWFSAGVYAEALHLVPNLVRLFKGVLSEIKPRNGYSFGLKVSLFSDTACTIFYGGSNVGSRIFVTSSGSFSTVLRDFLVSSYSRQSVLVRADVCLDFVAPARFDDLVNKSVYIAKTHRLKTGTVGDWIQKKDGRTLYIGSRTSPAFMRLYEKGKQLINGDPSLVRLEIECKPKNFEARRHWFSQPAHLFWTYNKWVSDLAERVTGSEVLQSSVYCGTVHRDPDHDRALHYMIKQYRNTILNELTFNGGDTNLLIDKVINFKEEI